MIPPHSADHSNTRRHHVNSSQNKSLAVLGGKGAYSYLAARKYFSASDNSYLACDSFESVLSSVTQGKVDYGVIPIENTTSGGITEVYDLLLESNLNIVGEEKYSVDHCLVGINSAQLTKINEIAAHPQASRQCNQNLKLLDLTNLKEAKIHLIESTAHALSYVVNENSTKIAAIACAEAAELFGLKVLKSEISNQTENITRFLVLARSPIEVDLSIDCKTSIALSTGQKAGSLAEVLSLFHQADILLCRLESRPILNKPWEQMFHLDLVGNISDPKVAQTLELLSHQCPFLRILGSYPTEILSINDKESTKN